jgi:hypothetical protein
MISPLHIDHLSLRLQRFQLDVLGERRLLWRCLFSHESQDCSTSPSQCFCSSLPVANCTDANPPTTAGLASSTTNVVASTPTPTDNTPLIAGAVGGSLLFLALVALVVFLVRRHKSAPVVARASQPSELRAANQYQAVRVNPPSVAYDVGQVERPREDDYSQLQIKPNSNYDVVNAEEPRYADPSILAPDSGPATRGIVAADTGVGTNYGRL